MKYQIKKLLAFLMTIAMVFQMIPTVLLAESFYQINSISYIKPFN